MHLGVALKYLFILNVAIQLQISLKYLIVWEHFPSLLGHFKIISEYKHYFKLRKLMQNNNEKLSGTRVYFVVFCKTCLFLVTGVFWPLICFFQRQKQILLLR